MSEQEARAYLQNVLNNWTEFLTQHKPFKEALQIILKENKNHETTSSTK